MCKNFTHVTSKFVAKNQFSLIWQINPQLTALLKNFLMAQLRFDMLKISLAEHCIQNGEI